MNSNRDLTLFKAAFYCGGVTIAVFLLYVYIHLWW